MSDWGPDFLWIESFWDTVTASQSGRSWVVAVLHEGDIILRDAVAWALIREQFGRRLRKGGVGDVDLAYVRAYAAEPEQACDDVIFIGRPRPYAFSRFARLAHDLESNAVGRFVDPGSGRLGDAIAYGRRSFRRHALDTVVEYPRYDVDYAVLTYRRAKMGGHRVVAISGLSSIGTLVLAMVLTDPSSRRELRRGVCELAGKAPGLRPEETFEICIRIDVDEESLAHFLERPRYRFTVVAVAVDGHTEPFLEPERTRQPEFAVLEEKDGAFFVSRAGYSGVRLRGHRALLLDELMEHGSAEPARIKELLKTGVTVTRVVHELNAALRKAGGLKHLRPVRLVGGTYRVLDIRLSRQAPAEPDLV
jgi:hypothetical protein